MKPFVVGLTGGFATGKSTVAQMFKKLGAEVVDCDRIAHRALEKGTESYLKILRVFGKEKIAGPGGKIDRKKLGAIVFREPKKRAALERIVHPFVFKEIGRILKRTDKKIAVVEMPLLFETGYERKVGQTLVVSAGLDTQIRRARKKFSIPISEIKRRIKAQMPLLEKKRRADFIINNNHSLKQTAREVKALWEKWNQKAVVLK